jgi:hypothetical protein
VNTPSFAVTLAPYCPPEHNLKRERAFLGGIFPAVMLSFSAREKTYNPSAVDTSFKPASIFLRKQRAGLQQPTKILLAGDDVFAFAGLPVFDDFVTHLQPFEMNDADVVLPAFPDLTLPKFECHKLMVCVGRKLVNLFNHGWTRMNTD